MLTLIMLVRGRVLAALSILGVITYLDRVAIAVCGPAIQQELHIGPEAWGLVGSVFALAYGVFEIPGGAMGDRLGPRATLTRIVLWWSAFTCLTGTVSNYLWLLVIRFAFGMGEAGAYPTISVSIARWFPAWERTRALGVVWMSSQLGGVFAPLLITSLESGIGWRGAFMLFGAIGFLWSAGWYVWYRDLPTQKAGVTAAELAQIGDTAPAHGSHAIPWRLLMQSRSAWMTATVAFCYIYGYYFFQSWLHTYLVKGRGFTSADLPFSALPYLLGAAGNFAGGYAGDALVRRFGLSRGRRMAGVIGLASAGLWMVVAAWAADKWIVLAALSLSYASITFQQPTMFSACIEIGQAHAGAMVGFMNTGAQVGSILSSAVFGLLVGYTGSYSAPIGLMAVMLLVGALLWNWIDAAAPLQEPAHPAA